MNSDLCVWVKWKVWKEKIVQHPHCFIKMRSTYDLLHRGIRNRHYHLLSNSLLLNSVQRKLVYAPVQLIISGECTAIQDDANLCNWGEREPFLHQIFYLLPDFTAPAPGIKTMPKNNAADHYGKYYPYLPRVMGSKNVHFCVIAIYFVLFP
mmetsp:Transcript_27769/g.50138  ORF Transcript_27769/g.50138 Transcript_27769/m.50138 type:complete len:151 (-) Transcript_27769:272-724(-)